MLLGEFIKQYLESKKGEKNKEVEFVQSLQTTGGFALKSLEPQILFNLQVENVYERLGHLSQNNIVAVSECIKGTPEPTNVVTNMLSKFPSVQMHGCDKDTGFVVGSSISISHEQLSSSCSVLNFNGIKIASVHLPGDGPNAKNQTIKKFLDENLENLKLHNVDVVLGDTNITDGKTSKTKNRKKDLEDYFREFFGGPCVVIMSNARIGKHRRGFILRNQQLKKSVPESFNDTEADGTIMAIKLSSKLTDKDKMSLAILSNLPIFTFSDVVNALEFRTKPNECLNEKGQPRERVWLDHSVLYISMRQLCSLIGKDYHESFPRNLIVVNMGSIVNAGHKNWNTRYISHQALINKYDKIFYEIIREYNLGKLPEYKDIVGSSMTKDKGVDEMEIYKDEDEEEKKIKKDIKEILDELKKKLQESLSFQTKYIKYKTKYLELKNENIEI